MARILAISSFVASGHVGLSAALPVFSAMGHETILLPTRVLSNHPAHPHSAAHDIPPPALAAMLDALDANGRLAGIDLVLTGYLPHPAYCDLARSAVARVRRQSPAARVLVDPILGDDPGGLYIAADAAATIRDSLMPVADIATPNRFELAWLSGQTVIDVASACAAARRLACPMVLASSISAPTGGIANVLTLADRVYSTTTDPRARVPQGTGDLLAALFAGHLIAGRSPVDSLALAVAGTDVALAACEGRDELALAGNLTAIVTAAPCSVEGAAARRG
jgi:pyridoxine kinase